MVDGRLGITHPPGGVLLGVLGGKFGGLLCLVVSASRMDRGGEGQNGTRDNNKTTTRHNITGAHPCMPGPLAGFVGRHA